MKVVRKKGIKNSDKKSKFLKKDFEKDVNKSKSSANRITISHNRGLFWFIIVLILFFIVFIIFSMGQFYSEKLDDEVEIIKRCETDSDCVPEICCHAATCVHISEKPDCSNLMCTMECIEGTMDCGGGSCGCVNGYCGVVVGG